MLSTRSPHAAMDFIEVLQRSTGIAPSLMYDCTRKHDVCSEQNIGGRWVDDIVTVNFSLELYGTNAPLSLVSKLPIQKRLLLLTAFPKSSLQHVCMSADRSKAAST